jgi:glutamate carboxypeptidase
MPSEFQPWLDWIDGEYDQMLSNTIALAEINSGSLNADGVNQVGELVSDLFSPLEAKRKTFELPPYKRLSPQGHIQELNLGNAITLSKRPEAPLQIFLCGHLDTVFAKENSFQKVTWLDGETLNGPGVTDLKGGLMVMLKALQAFERTPWSEQIGWSILFNPDEEIGSPGSAPLINEMTTNVDLGLIYEPSLPDGNLAGARKGSGNFGVLVRGRTAHAGREHHLGRNAIRAMCDFVSALDNLNGKRAGVTFNPGTISGGTSTNAVPDRCVAHFNIRIEQPEDEAWCLEEIKQLIAEINSRDGIHIELQGGFGRKPKVLTPENLKLFELTRECGMELGTYLSWHATGGCCDGNNLASAGIPNIDTLGVKGGKIHSSDEYLNVKSLTERAKLSALLLMKLATSDTHWLRQRRLSRNSPNNHKENNHA